MVTGASSGIGPAIARELHRPGTTVVMAARSRERLDGAMASVGDGCTTVVADVTCSEDVERLVGGTIETQPASTALVADAGVYVGDVAWSATCSRARAT